MRELPLNLQLNEDDALYIQIYRGIRDEIMSGSILTGEKLPSSRNLASCLQVSRTTVDEAYSQLVSEGYVEAVEKKGYFVCRLDGIYTVNGDREENINGSDFAPDTIIDSLKGTKKENIDRTISKKATPTEWLFDFSPMTTDMSEFPFSTWKKIMRGIMVDARSSMFMMGSPQGDAELRNTICRYLHGSRGVACSPDQLIIGAGNDYLLLLLSRIIGNRRNIAMENPSYTRACRMFSSMGSNVIPIDIDHNGIIPDKLRSSDADTVYLMPAHQFPMGFVMPASRRAELIKWASEDDDRYIIEDDYDSEFRYKGRPVPSLQGNDRFESVIYVGTFSKSIAPAIRISYMVLPERLIGRYRENCGFYSSTVSRIDQAILNEFISAGYFERYLNKMRKRYKIKHDEMLEGLECFRCDFDISGEDAGLHMVLTDKRQRSEEVLIKEAGEKGIRVYGNRDNYIAAPPKESPARILLGYAPLSLHDIDEGLRILHDAWKI